MKRTIGLLAGLALFLVCLTVGFLWEPSLPETTEKKRFACIVCEPEDGYWGEFKKGIALADKEYGTDTRISTFSMLDLDAQVQELKETSWLKLDGVITVGDPGSEELNQMIQKIRELDIPVVLVDTDSAESQRNCYIGTDNYRAGWMAAAEILNRTGQSAQAAVLTTGQDSSNQAERVRGFQERLQKSKTSRILEININAQNKQSVQENLTYLVETYPDLNAIFCSEASTTEMVSLALKRTGLNREIVIVGFDDLDATMEAVRDGRIAATIVQDPGEMGKEAVQALLSLSEKEEETSVIYTEVLLVTSENMDAYKLLKNREQT